MNFPRFPKTFETGFFIFLVAFWLISLMAERTTLGRVILGYRSELYPMSTFAVYTGPKQQQASVFKFDVVKAQGDEPIEIDAYDLFYPIEPPDLDDELATRQLYSIVDSFRKQCPKNQGTRFSTCERNPSEEYVLQKDIGAMFLGALEHHLGITSTPYSLTLKQHKYPFSPETYQITKHYQQYFVTFYPTRDANRPDGWVGYKPEKKDPDDTFETTDEVDSGNSD